MQGILRFNTVYLLYSYYCINTILLINPRTMFTFYYSAHNIIQLLIKIIS